MGFRTLLLENVLQHFLVAAWYQLLSHQWTFKIFKMYREWAVVNILMMSYVYLVQGFNSEHGPVKVGELDFFRNVSFCWFSQKKSFALTVVKTI